MHPSNNPSQQGKHNILSKTSSSKSCQSLLCLTQRCCEDEPKTKQKMLNYQFFQKLSLKKFNHSASFHHSFYEKDRNDQKVLKRDKSTEENQFQNIKLSPKNEQVKFSIGQHHFKNVKHIPQFDDSRRIVRSSSYRQLDRPQLKSTDRSIEKELELDFRRIQDLQMLRNRLETEMKQLDQSIDKYYLVYNKKLEELKRIQAKMKQIDSEKESIKIPNSDQFRSFKKKSYNFPVTLNNAFFQQKPVKYENGPIKHCYEKQTRPSQGYHH